MNTALIKAVVALVPTSLLFAGTVIVFVGRKTVPAFLQHLRHRREYRVERHATMWGEQGDVPEWIDRGVNTMFEGALQPLHWVVVLAIALVFFGPQRLPELGKALGEAIRGFKTSMRDVESGAATGKNDRDISKQNS